MCETLSSRQFLERQEAAVISSQKVNTDCWHLLIIFSWANCTSLLPPINVFWWQRARWNNKTARLTAPAKRLTDYSGFYISEQPESEQLPPLAKKKQKPRSHGNLTTTALTRSARTEQRTIWFVIGSHRRVSLSFKHAEWIELSFP